MGTALVAEELPDADELDELYRLDASESRSPRTKTKMTTTAPARMTTTTKTTATAKTTATGDSSLAKCRTSE